MSSLGRTSLVAAAVALGLLVVLTSASGLPFAPFRAAGVLLAECLHLGCAFVAGAALLRLVRTSPPNALGLAVFALSSGLAILSLLTLALGGLGFTNAATPWIVDGLALLFGAGRIGPASSQLRDSLARLDLSFVMASRIPLLAAVTMVGLMHLAPPFLPSGPDTGAAEQALSAQAAVRKDLREALLARPGDSATPIDGLLLHGRLAAGEAGGRLHVAVLAALLTCAAFLHGSRRLGGQTAAWAALCLASSPALLLLDAASPSGTWLALHGFLFFAELSDWSARPSPGRVALAFLHGGLCAAQSAAGLAAFLTVLAFLILVEALLERHALVRLLAGLAGLVLIAALTALPFVAVDSWLRDSTPWEAAADRWLEGDAEDSLAGWAGAGIGLLDADAQVGTPLRRLATLGPLILCLLILTPLAPEAPEGLRHAVMMLLLALGCWALPPPWGTGALVLAAAALCAGASARALLATGGASAKLTGSLVALATPVTLLLVFNAGPSLFAGAGIMTGTMSRADVLARTVPDHALIVATSGRTDAHDLVLLVGELTDCQYQAPVLRWPAVLEVQEPGEFARALLAAEVSHVAVDHAADQALTREAFASFERVDGFAPDGRYALYRVPDRPAPSLEDEASAPLPVDDEAP